MQCCLRCSFASLASMLGAAFALLAGTFAAPVAAQYAQTNLVSDIPGLATITDPNLKNPWGIASSATSPFWVSNNGTGTSTLYNSLGQPFPVGSPLVVTIPPTPGGTPTGQVFNGGSGFEVAPGKPARFIFATEAGTIAGWNPAASATNAIIEVDSVGAIYTGLAIGNNASGDFLYAANFANGAIDVFDSFFAPTSLSGSFLDPGLPSGYAPFNVQNLGGTLYVTYAVYGASGDDVPGAGNGIVDAFDTDGNLVRRVVSPGNVLNSPWGLALAPAGFGEFGSALLVGNFGDGVINAFNPTSGALLGTLTDVTNKAIVNDGLWGLQFGNGGNGGAINTLYFTAGLNDEQNGLFGSIASVAAVPEPASLALVLVGVLAIFAGGTLRQRRSASRN
jgi:uncharacterized protein (TIGR03118 family)